MKRMTVLKRATLAAMAFFLLPLTVVANEIKLLTSWSSSDAINVDAAWEGGVQPGVDDIAVFEGVGGTYTTGGAVSWGGIKTKSLTDTLKLGLTKNEKGTITLGAYGIQNQTSSKPFYLNTPVVMNVDQAWSNTASQAFQFNSTITGSGHLSFYSKGNFAINKVPAPAGGLLVLGPGQGYLNATDAAFTSDLSIETNKAFYISYAVAGGPYSKLFSDIFATRTLKNDGRFATSRLALMDVTLEEGDKIVGTERSFESAEDVAAWDGKEGHFVVDGGTVALTGGLISNNTIAVQSGVLAVSGGKVYAAANVVTGSRFNRSLTNRQDVIVSGGELTAGAIRLGMKNNDIPAQLIVSNGTVNIKEKIELGFSGAGTTPAQAVFEQWGGVVRTTGISQGEYSTNAVKILGGDLYVGAEGVSAPPENAVGTFEISNATYHVAADHEIGLPVNVSGEAAIEVPAGATFAPTTTFSGTGGLHKSGAGVIDLSGATLSYAGKTGIDGGTAIFGSYTNDAPTHTADYDVTEATVTMDGDSAVSLASDDTTTYMPFSYEIMKKIKSTAVAPVLGAAINGHQTLSFSGENCGLAMTTQSGSRPWANATTFSVAIVFRATKGYGSATETDWRKLGGIVSVNENVDRGAWGVRLDEAGHIVFGVATNAAPNCESLTTVRDNASVFDGRAHVVIGTFSGAEGKVRVIVDGKRTECETTVARLRSSSGGRATLGVGEERTALTTSGGVQLRPAECEVAEVLFFGNQSLTEAKENALGLTLALKYDSTWAPSADPTATLPGGGLSVAAGATAVLDSKGAVLGSGQTISGAGRIMGGEVSLGASAALESGSLAIDRLAFAAGARISVSFVDGTCAAPTVGDVSFPNGTVTFDVSGSLPTENVVVFRWAGTAQGIENTTFAASNATLKPKVNLVDKTITLKPTRGFVIVFQ